MDTPILVAIITLLVAPIASLATWFINRKKGVADIYNALSEASQTSVEMMQTTLEVVKEQLEEAQQKIDEISIENKQLHIDMCELKEQNKKLLRENEYLKKQVTELTATLQDLVSRD